MTSKAEILIWSDLKSKTMSINDYKKKFFDKKRELFQNYEDYGPKKETIEKIKELLSKTEKNAKILAIGAEWCPDCSQNIPRMVKIIENFENANIDFQILYGVKVNAFKKKGESLWHKRKSPPEATSPKFNLMAIPTFFLFINDKYKGRIVEKPKEFSTLEEELLNILQKKE